MELRIANLSKTYPNGTAAVQNVDLTIPAGMFGLLGPNGAGKSTLMRIIATLQEPDSGSITLGDIDVLRDKPALRRTLGYLPQEFGLYPKVSAERLLDHFAVLEGIIDSKQRKAVTEALLQRTNLWHARKVKVGEYSGGMRQRFGIAVALLGDPRLIIVDEPTAGLDPEERVRFLNLLAEIGRDSVVILSTHIVDDVAELCSRMAIISSGKIRMRTEPTTAIDLMRGKVWRAIIDHGDLETYREKHRVLSNRLNLGNNVVRVFNETSPGEEFQAAEPDLEDVYFATLRELIDTDAAPVEVSA
ncbi:ABC transporter ATP-binding protein [bacterium]|nr:ABC transporter ATP-binding protein [bacterium]